MSESPAEVQARRDVEDEAMRLGAERTQLAGRLRNNTAKIDALLLRAVDVGIPIEHYSRMVGVSRQTLYRWRNALVSLRAARG